MKPCTKLQYPKESQHKVSNPNFRAEFALSFGKPALVAVKEEYLIYDLVSMIGAIGGTLGLCIGFSFVEVCRSLLRIIESFLFKLNVLRKGESKSILQERHVKIAKTSNGKKCDLMENQTEFCKDHPAMAYCNNRRLLRLERQMQLLMAKKQEVTDN